MSRWWLGLLMGGAWGCGSEPESSPWDGRAQTLPCGFEPAQCLTGPAEAPQEGELVRGSSAVVRYLRPDEYAGTATAGCELGFVYSVPPENLAGNQLQIIGWWSESEETVTRGLERCAEFDGTMHVYTPDPSARDGFRLVDHRIFEGEANEQRGLCDLSILSGGPGEPSLPRNQAIWLTAPRYPRGLRIVVSALDACEPQTLRFSITEEFPEAGEPQPEVGAQSALPPRAP